MANPYPTAPRSVQLLTNMEDKDLLDVLADYPQFWRAAFVTTPQCRAFEEETGTDVNYLLKELFRGALTITETAELIKFAQRVVPELMTAEEREARRTELFSQLERIQREISSL